MNAATHTPIVAASARPSIALRVHPDLPRLVLGEGVVAQQLSDATIAPIPMSAAWFRGVARHGGQIVPFFDLARWADIPRTDDKPSVLLSVIAGTCVMGLVASESPAILPAGRPVAAWSGRQHWLAQGGSGEVAYSFDPSAWLTEIAPTIGFS